MRRVAPGPLHLHAHLHAGDLQKGTYWQRPTG